MCITTYRICEFFSSRLAIFFVVLDPKIFSRPPRVVTSRKNNSSLCHSAFPSSNGRRNCWSGHNPTLWNPNARNTISSKDTANNLDRFGVEVSSITCDDNAMNIQGFGIMRSLHEKTRNLARIRQGLISQSTHVSIIFPPLFSTAVSSRL